MIVLLTLMSATVGLSLEDTRGVSGREAQAIVETLAHALEDRVGVVRVDEGAECARSPRCFAIVRGRTQSDALVYVRLIGVPTRIRVMVTRVPAGRDEPDPEQTIDLERNRSTWPRALRRLIATVFPEPPPPVELPPPIVSAPPPKTSSAPPPPAVTIPRPKSTPESDGPSVGPWIVLGVGAAALATGIGFGVSSQGARNRASGMPATSIELRELEDRAIGHGVVANVAFGVSAAAVIGGVVWLLVD